jgi:integrase
MSIDKRPNGRYRARVREYAGGPERTKQFVRKVDAERWEAEQRVALSRGTYLTADEMSITIGQYVETHISRQVWRDRTVDLARGALKRAEDHFGTGRPLTAIRRGDVEAFIVKQSKVLAAGTVRTTFQHLRTMMRSALADGLINVDPTMKIKLPKVTTELTILPPTDVHALIAAADPQFRAAIVLGAFVGLRAGEAQGLFVSDVDFLRRTVNVRRQLDGRSTVMHLCEPKTSASTRSIPVPSDVLDILAAHIAEFGSGTDGVLLHRGGGYMSDNEMNRLWRRAQVGAGHKAGALRFHWLRHAFASSLISAGCSVKAVADAMGHQSPTITLQTYASLWPGDEDRIRIALGEAWRVADQTTDVSEPVSL